MNFTIQSSVFYTLSKHFDGELFIKCTKKNQRLFYNETKTINPYLGKLFPLKTEVNLFYPA